MVRAQPATDREAGAVVDFVNPYTFVALDAAPDRGRPGGHARLGADRLAGSLRVAVTARTPLLIRGFGDVPAAELLPEEGAGPVADVPRRADRRTFIPGSSLLGAVRSLHEALAGGCLRVVDEDYRPVHRHPATTRETAPVRLAVVRAVDDTGAPTSVTMAVRTIWVPTDMLTAVPGAPLTTGDRLRLTDERVVEDHGRYLLLDGAIASAGGMRGDSDGTWALLVTDTKARDPKRRAYFAAGLVGAGGQAHDVDPAAVELFRRCVDDSDDVRVYRRDHGRQDPSWSGARPEPVEVRFPAAGLPGVTAGPVVGQRLPARPYVFPGQPVWVRVERKVVTELRLSLLWRYEGSGPVGQRVGAAGPCDDPAALCPSCQLFGSVDERGRAAGDRARQRAYRGHVRIEDAIAAAPVRGLPWDVAPLGAPRPSAGQFYLNNAGKTPSGRYERPAARWGSPADAGGLRRIRGRKFYWRTTGADGSPRGQARPHHKRELTQRVRLIPAGSRFETRVALESLTRAQVGGLLAALDPRLLFPGEPTVVSSVGGGRPFGFGAVTVDVTVELLDSAASRYLGEQAPSGTLAELVDEFRASVPARLRGIHRELRAALTFGAVDDDLVWYPPGAGERGSDKHDQGFDFWQLSAGVAMHDGVRPLVGLAAPDQQDQALPSRPRLLRASR